MTKSEFLAKLAKSFPQKISAEMLSEIESFVAMFNESNISRLWSVFEVDYLLQSAPRKGHLVKIARDNEIFPESRDDGRKYVSVCYVCASQGKPHRFNLASPKCPGCDNSYAPWRSTGLSNVQISQEAAQKVLDMYPQGIHPKYGKSDAPGMAKSSKAPIPGIPTAFPEFGSR